MANKLMDKAMGKGTAPLKQASPSKKTSPAAPTPSPAAGLSGMDRKYQIEDAARVLVRAAEIRKDKKLMKEVVNHTMNQHKIVSSMKG